MTAKEYLEQIGNLEHKIHCMKLRSKEYDRLSFSIPGPSYGEKIGSNPNRNLQAPFLKWLIKKDEIDREIVALEEKLKNLKAEALLKIEELENEDYKNVLIMRYFNGLSWMEIGNKLYCSEKTARRWHDNAIEMLKM